MNEQQSRLLLETELEFYRLGTDPATFQDVLRRQGLLDLYRSGRLSADQLKTLNLLIRSKLRAGQM